MSCIYPAGIFVTIQSYYMQETWKVSSTTYVVYLMLTKLVDWFLSYLECQTVTPWVEGLWWWKCLRRLPSNNVAFNHI